MVAKKADFRAGSAAMAVGAAAGSAILPPAGTVVGAVTGAGLYLLANLKLSIFDPPRSVVQATIDLVNKGVDVGGDLASKAVDGIGNAVSNVGKKLDKIFW